MDTEKPLLASPTYPEHITSLRESLQHQDQEISQAYLMGISGEAFRFFYSRLDPLKGHRVFLQNPLRSACSALGYKYTVHYDDDPANARRRLEGHLKQKQDVIIETDHDWPLVRYAYHPGKVTTVSGRQKEIALESLMRRWNPIDGMFELGPTGYYQFVVEKQDRTPNDREAALGSLRRAVKMLKGDRRIQGCAMGLAALEELTAHLNQLAKSKEVRVKQMERIAEWRGTPLAELIQSRRYALAYLRLIEEHFEGDERKQLDLAIKTYEELLSLYSGLVNDLPRMPHQVEVIHEGIAIGQVVRRSAVPFRAASRRAVKRMVKIVKAETQIADAFHQIVRISERTKM